MLSASVRQTDQNSTALFKWQSAVVVYYYPSFVSSKRYLVVDRNGC